MQAEPEYRYISADNHIDMLWLPKDLWSTRVPSQFVERAPHVVETDSGTVWEWEGKPQVPVKGTLPNTGSADGRDNAKHLERFTKAGVDVPAGSLPPTTPQIILRHLDMAGIYAAVFYGATRKWQIQDDELLSVCYRAYNDWVTEFNAASPFRLFALPAVPTRLPEAAYTECQRLADLGARAIEFSPFDAGRPIFDPVWEPIWSLAEEADIAICCHIGDKAGTPYPPNEWGESKAHFTMAPLTLLAPLTHFVFGGVCARHPRLRLALGECNIGWVPYFLWCMDRQEREREADAHVSLDLLPSEYFERQITVSFEEDAIGVGMLNDESNHLASSAVWAADYPHNHVTWPQPGPVVKSLFRDVDPEIATDVLWRRAADFWKIPLPPQGLARV